MVAKRWLMVSWLLVGVGLLAAVSPSLAANPSARFAIAPTAETPPPATPTLAPMSPTSYQDPDGLFSVPIPAGWKAVGAQGYGFLTDPDGAIDVYVLSVPGDDAGQGIAAAWAVIDPSFTLQPKEVSRPPVAGGVEQAVNLTYDTGDPQRTLSAFGQRVKGRVYAILVDGDAAALALHASQLQAIQSGLTINALSGAKGGTN